MSIIKYYKIILYSLFQCVLLSCIENKGVDKKIGHYEIIGGDSIVVCDLANTPKTVRNIELSLLIDSMKLVRLENKDEALVNVGLVPTITENHIGIYSYGKKYKLFDINGKYLCDIGSVGKGSGEYIDVYADYIDEINQCVYILPWVSKRIIVFNFQGDYIGDIPLAYQVYRSNFYIEVEKKQITVFSMPQKDMPYLIWKQDFDGNILQSISAQRISSENIKASSEVWFLHNTCHFDYYLYRWNSINDTLYNYDPIKNVISPRLTVRFSNKEKTPQHCFYELPNHYIIEIAQRVGNVYQNFILLDKRTLTGFYYKLNIDDLGNITDDYDLPPFKNGYYAANIYAITFKEKLQDILKHRDRLATDQYEKLGLLESSISEDDNNIILYGKLKSKEITSE